MKGKRKSLQTVSYRKRAQKWFNGNPRRSRSSESSRQSYLDKKEKTDQANSGRDSNSLNPPRVEKRGCGDSRLSGLQPMAWHGHDHFGSVLQVHDQLHGLDFPVIAKIHGLIVAAKRTREIEHFRFAAVRL